MRRGPRRRSSGRARGGCTGGPRGRELGGWPLGSQRGSRGGSRGTAGVSLGGSGDGLGGTHDVGDGVKVGGLVGADGDGGHIWRSRVSSVDGMGFGLSDEDGLVKNLMIWQQQSITRVNGIKVKKMVWRKTRAWLAGVRVYCLHTHPTLRVLLPRLAAAYPMSPPARLPPRSLPRPSFPAGKPPFLMRQVG